MPKTHPKTGPSSDHRKRLLEGLARAVAQRGYMQTTIADIVREAGVSRRTFYEHFDGKSRAFIELYEDANRRGLRSLRQGIDSSRSWRQQIGQLYGLYFGSLAENPVLLRTLFMEILTLGPPGLSARQRVNAELAELLMEVVNGHGQADPLSRVQAGAAVGVVYEWVLQYIEQDRIMQLPELKDAASQMLQCLADARQRF